MSFQGILGETVVLEMDRRGYAISAGAACSAHAGKPSAIYSAVGLDESSTRGTVRVSFGRFCTEESAVALAQALTETVKILRK
jgi:cysteine desulfurase